MSDISVLESEPTVAGRREKQIDRLVYHLYDLAYDEVLIVNPDTPITKEEYESKK